MVLDETMIEDTNTCAMGGIGRRRRRRLCTPTAPPKAESIDTKGG